MPLVSPRDALPSLKICFEIERALSERRHRHSGMQMVGRDDVDEVDGRVAQQRIEVAVDGDARKVGRGGTGRCVAAAQHGRERQSGNARDGADMHAAPGAVPDQADAYWLSVVTHMRAIM